MAPTRSRVKRLIMAMLVLIVAGLLGAAIAIAPWAEIAVAMAQADPVLLLLALMAAAGVYPLWIWQWRLIAAPIECVRWRVMAQIVALSISARFTASGLGGIASGGAALHAQAGLSVTEAAGVMTVDQLLAGVAKLGVLALALALAPVPDAVRMALLGLAVALAGAAALLAVLPRLGWLVPGRLAASVTRFSAEFGRLLPARVLVPATALAFAKKGLEVAGAYAIQRALGIDASPVLALLAVASISLVTLLPIAPVHLGPQAMAVFATYVALGVPTAEAISVAVLHQVLMLMTTLGIGAVALTLSVAPSRSRRAP